MPPQVARSSDFGRNDTVYYVRTHLGNILHPGDMALGYDLANANATGLDFDAFVAKCVDWQAASGGGGRPVAREGPWVAGGRRNPK